MRRVIYGIEVILIIIIVGIISFFNMNAPRYSSVSLLENEPCYEELKNIYLELLQDNSAKIFTREEKYLLSQAGFTLVDEKTEKYEIRKKGEILNIYNPRLFKKSSLLFEIYYLTENHVLVRNSDNKTLGELNSK